MKGLRIVFIILICMLLLAGCGERTLYGEVTRVDLVGTSDSFSFVLEQENGESLTVRADSQTHIFSWIPEVSESDLRDGTGEGIMVSVSGRVRGSDVEASQVQIEGLLVRDAYNLSDGTPVDLLCGLNQKIYRLKDGTDLLQVQYPVGPDNVSVGGTENLDALSPEAQQCILNYYDAQGILFDEYQTLEDAYNAWHILKDDFDGYLLGQEIVPTASNEEIIYFMTVVTAPDRETGGHSELRLGTGFRRETGEPAAMADLFVCGPEELISRLAAICKIEDKALIEEMKGSFDPRYVIIFPDSLEITFPGGVLTDHGTSFTMASDFSDEVSALLQPWALPNGSGLES